MFPAETNNKTCHVRLNAIAYVGQVIKKKVNEAKRKGPKTMRQ